MKKIISILCLTLFLIAPAALAEAQVQSPAAKYIDSLTANVPTVTAEKLRKMLAADENGIVLLDVRTFYERSETKTILGEKEVHIPRGFLEVKAWDAVPKDKIIIVYCSKGTRSKLAVNTLKNMGWTEVSSLQGGVKAWYDSVDEPCECLPDNQEIPDKASQECKP
jgi:rhodanese-related sulfurtransferase